MVNYSNKIYLNRKRGISTVIGGIIFLVLLTAGFSSFFVAMDVQQDTINAQRTISNSIIEKTQEQFSIAVGTDDSNSYQLGIQVKNEGPNPVQISNIWIINKSDVNYPVKNIPINYNDAFITPGTNSSILETQLLYMIPNEYDIKVVSVLGTIKKAELNVGGNNYLLAEMFTIPPDVRRSENATLVLRVTNVGPTLITGINPTDLLADDFALPHAWINGIPQLVSPSSLPVELEPSESVIFSWHATLNNIGTFDEKIKFSSSATGTESTTGFVVTSNTASDKIIIRDPAGGAGEEEVLKDELFGKPKIFMIIPNAAGDEDANTIDRPIWGVMVANPTDQDMYVNKVVIIAISPRATASDSIFESGCEGLNPANPERPVTIAPTPAKWSCPDSNQLMWTDLASPQLVDPRSVFPFLVSIGAGNMGGNLPDAQNILIQPLVFTTLGQFGKAGYGSTMHSGDVALPNVFLARNPNSVLSADIMGEQRGIIEGTPVTFHATIADMSDNDDWGIKAGSRLIINIPKEWTFNNIVGVPAGFDPIPPPITYPDGSTQILGTLNTSIDEHSEAKTITFIATAPSVSKAKLYVMYILGDGTATGDSANDFTVGPIAETVLQVCPSGGCP